MITNFMPFYYFERYIFNLTPFAISSKHGLYATNTNYPTKRITLSNNHLTCVL